MKRVPAWDARTGKKLPESVPQSWLDRDLFPHLTDKEPAHASDAVSETPSESWSLDALRSYATANNIDLTGASKKADILALIAPTQKEA